MDKINQHANNLLNSLVNKGSFERFTWGLTTDEQLNHHPTQSAGRDIAHWTEREFSDDNKEIFLRIERQVTVGLPDINSFIFTIRTYYRNVMTFKPVELEKLINALRSMPQSVLAYKGLEDHRDIIIDRLSAKVSP